MDFVFLNSPRFSDDLMAVLENSKDGKIKAMIIPSSLEDVGKNVALCDKHDKFKLYTTCGVHPHNTGLKEFNLNNSIDEIKRIANKEKRVVAIGESGIDMERRFYPLEPQKQSFLEHIKLALSLNLPLIFLAKKSHTEIIKIFKTFDVEELEKIPKVLMCYDGLATPDEIDYYNSIGCYFGICGLLNDDSRNESIINTLANMPVKKYISTDKIVTMTYGPFYSPVQNYKSEPQYMQHIIQKLNVLLDVDCETLNNIVEANYKTIFPTIELLSDDEMQTKTLKTTQIQNTYIHPKNKQTNTTEIYVPSFLKNIKDDNPKEEKVQLDINDESQFPSLSSSSK